MDDRRFMVLRIGRPIAQVVNADLDQPFLKGFVEKALGKIARENLWKQRDDIDSHNEPKSTLSGKAAAQRIGWAGSDGNDLDEASFEVL